MVPVNSGGKVPRSDGRPNVNCLTLAPAALQYDPALPLTREASHAWSSPNRAVSPVVRTELGPDYAGAVGRACDRSGSDRARNHDPIAVADDLSDAPTRRPARSRRPAASRPRRHSAERPVNLLRACCNQPVERITKKCSGVENGNSSFEDRHRILGPDLYCHLQRLPRDPRWGASRILLRPDGGAVHFAAGAVWGGAFGSGRALSDSIGRWRGATGSNGELLAGL